MDGGSPVPRKGRKYDQVLKGARQVFLTDGFEGASVDDIARAAEVSKATLYKYFPDKQHLFLEVARQECIRMADAAEAEIKPSSSIRQMLLQAATQITRFMVSPFSMRIFRICVAESDRFPELGRQFYSCGPQLGRERLRAFMQEAHAAGALNIDDFDLAADQFGELCRASLWPRMVFGMQSDFTEAEIQRVAQGTADMFIARYGTDQDEVTCPTPE
ncbi:TetR/AcrR family transcriptional regulator [Mesobacterium pallidum]|uniref:TetR/AcrR family transcriptional regulator n=1 Tax=Mesobacterium pallidum TaxID=2872037 RepID=UPI001EE32632|nr:TetR/AcrR family transcriptional regulator [Mesobacterium pallidum]